MRLAGLTLWLLYCCRSRRPTFQACSPERINLISPTLDVVDERYA